jgi:hypothetical protein
MNIWILFIDPDNGSTDDVETFAFSTEMAALRARNELIEDGCESILTVRRLRVTDQWVINREGGDPNETLRIGDGK